MDFLSLQTRFLSTELYPFGSSILTSSNRSSLRKALSISSCKIDQFLATTTAKKNSNWCKFSNWRKSIRKINASLLCVALNYQSSFVAIHNAIRFEFRLIHPPAANALFSNWKGNQGPCVIGFQSFDLSCHGLVPFWKRDSLMIELWLINCGNLSNEVLIRGVEMD